MRSESEILCRICCIEADLEHLDKKENFSENDAIVKHELELQRKMLKWCLT